jgi:hypothetical protein
LDGTTPMRFICDSARPFVDTCSGFPSSSKRSNLDVYPYPTMAPTRAPTAAPTIMPTRAPTFAPTFAPTRAPTLASTRPPACM